MAFTRCWRPYEQSANARFGWLSTAGTGLFIVYNDGEFADSFFSWRQPQSRRI